jgi:hypothetical protein
MTTSPGRWMSLARRRKHSPNKIAVGKQKAASMLLPLCHGGPRGKCMMRFLVFLGRGKGLGYVPWWRSLPVHTLLLG